jgi:hypothetical protein
MCIIVLKFTSDSYNAIFLWPPCYGSDYNACMFCAFRRLDGNYGCLQKIRVMLAWKLLADSTLKWMSPNIGKRITYDHLHSVLSPHVDHITSHDITSHHIISHDITSWVNKRIWHFTALHSTVQQSAGECSNIDRYCHYALSQTPDLT